MALGSWAVGPGREVVGGRQEALTLELGLSAHVLGPGASPGCAASSQMCWPSGWMLSCVFGELLPTLCSDSEDASGHPQAWEGGPSPQVRAPRGSQVSPEMDLVE